ncbi:hypothetical protein F0562_031038 [Nyssa sinensis]|uniref:RING-type domain-containing protein n=1 Tax=Nyssa sinensis TaxID=561372 RepID=A0A5J5AT79_9ASTE|nr:hypothetical protein F0562_031038 [Nyssa sinensis]
MLLCFKGHVNLSFIQTWRMLRKEIIVLDKGKSQLLKATELQSSDELSAVENFNKIYIIDDGEFGDVVTDLQKAILMVLHSRLFLLISKTYSFHEQKTHDISPEYHPSPSLVPIPVNFINESIKERLRVIEYSCFLEKSSRARKQDEQRCAVCLNCMQASNEVRELRNCCHVFHRDCLDAWIDKGHVTCPLCRSKLFHDQGGEELSRGGDPWRVERMVYLFGEDYVMSA